MVNSENPIIETFSFKEPAQTLRVPYLASHVAAGFPSPADDHLDSELDLVELLIKRPAATFYVRVEGKSMRGAGIREGDILIVDRSESALDGSMIIAALNGECLVKFLHKEAGRTWLQAANPDFLDIEITEESQFQVWGVVMGVVRQHGNHGRVRPG